MENVTIEEALQRIIDLRGERDKMRDERNEAREAARWLYNDLHSRQEAAERWTWLLEPWLSKPSLSSKQD